MACSEDGATLTLLPPLRQVRHGRNSPVMPRSGRHGAFSACVWCLPLVADCDSNSCVEDVLDTILLFTTALHVQGTHLLGNSATLLGSHRRQALGLQQLNAVLLVAKIRLETEEHQWCCGAEVEDFRVPLGEVSACN